MGKKKIVIDTNNLISALGWEGKSRELLWRVIDEKYELVISLKQINELKRVMDYPKFKFVKEQKELLLKLIFEIAIVIDTISDIKVIADISDNMLLECAVEGRANYIISRMMI